MASCGGGRNTVVGCSFSVAVTELVFNDGRSLLTLLVASFSSMTSSSQSVSFTVIGSCMLVASVPNIADNS